MAVLDKYVDSDIAAGLLADRSKLGGGELITFNTTVAVAAGDDDDSVFRLFRVLDTFKPVVSSTTSIINTSAITGGTDFVLGLYEVGVGGVVVDADIFMTTTSLATAAKKDAFVAVNTPTNMGKAIWELLGKSAPESTQYDVALTANTIGSVAGTAAIQMQFDV